MGAPQRTALSVWRTGLLFALLLLSLPLIVAGIGLITERAATRTQVELLERVSLMTNGWERQKAEVIGASDGIIIARLDAQGATMFRTGPVRFDGGALGQTLDAVDARFPPWPARDEVRAALAGKRALGRYRKMGEAAVVLALAQPAPNGGVLYAMTGSNASALSGLAGKVNLAQLAALLALFGIRHRRRQTDGAAR